MRTVALLAMTVAALTLEACRPRQAIFTAEDEAGIRGMLQARAAYLRAGDWVKWSLQHADSIIIQPANAPSIHGRAAILAWGQSFPPIDSLVLSDIQIRGDGNLAYATAVTTLKLRDQPLATGKELLVFRRSPSADWQVVAFSLSPNQPPSISPVANTATNR